MSRFHLKSTLAAALLGLFLAQPGAMSAELANDYQITSDMKIYLGIMPVALLMQHPNALPAGHPLPSRAHSHHVMIAIFDRATGERITNAEVTAWVATPKRMGVKHRLHPMSVAGYTTYCNFFRMLPSGANTIGVEVRRPGNGLVNTVTFRHSTFRG